MIRLTIILIYFSVSADMFSQYIKLPLDTNHIWQESWIDLDFSPYHQCNFQLKSVSDVTINSTVYQKVDQFKNICSPGFSTHYSGFDIFRQDTIRKIVITRFNNQEYILYNFNKNVGDTAKMIEYFGGPWTYTLTSKDSLLLNDGLYHERFVYNTTYTMVEGVGSTRGLGFTSINPFSGGYVNLNCLVQVNPTFLTLYPPNYSCSLITQVPENIRQTKYFSIFPNPTNKTLNIDIADLSATKIQITDIIGRILFASSDNSSFIDVSNFDNGIYFVQINTPDKTLTRQFIKTD